jgi:hypothetical protein
LRKSARSAAKKPYTWPRDRLHADGWLERAITNDVTPSDAPALHAVLLWLLMMAVFELELNSIS